MMTEVFKDWAAVIPSYWAVPKILWKKPPTETKRCIESHDENSKEIS